MGLIDYDLSSRLQCSYCDANYAQKDPGQSIFNLEKDDLDTHMKQRHIVNGNSGNKSHTSTRFKCSYCDSNYAQNNDLDTHIKQKHEENGNSGDKTRFQCSYCDCNYARKATLQKHEENCKSVGQFQCPYCVHIATVHEGKNLIKMLHLFIKRRRHFVLKEMDPKET